MTAWTLSYDRFQPEEEGLRESLCALGNGRFVTRGAAPEAEADDIHYPGTYLAGGYNRLTSEVAGRVVENEDLVNLPNWLPLTFRVDGGAWFNLRAVEILAFRQELALRDGVLRRTVRFRDREGRESTLDEQRFVSMADPQHAVLETVLTAHDWTGRLELRSAVDGRVVNAGVERYRALNGKHLAVTAVEALGEDAVMLCARTVQSGIGVAMAVRTRTFRHDAPAGAERSKDRSAERSTELGDETAAQVLRLDLSRGESVRVEKVLAFASSRDRAIADPATAARLAIGRALDAGALLARHRRSWKHLWRRCDMEFAGPDGATGMALRLHVFHLLQTVSKHSADMDAGVPARGWTGEAYRGHIFWDELFIFPFLNLRIPEMTRALLLYRYRRLDEARWLARAAGFAGALFPWQSGSSGREESQVLHLNPRSGHWLPDNTHLQRHINAAVAYNVWQYYQVTSDVEFLHVYGAEMLLEIARFWASAATWNERLGRHEIRGVMGPDEYHDAYPGREAPGIDNNAYTNILASWVLCRAARVLDLLPEERRSELRDTLELRDEELEHWDRVSRTLRLCFHRDGILSQFEGYEALKELDWEAYRGRHGNAMRLDRILNAEGDTPNAYKASKQADVLMLFYLFSAEQLAAIFGHLDYPFDPADIPRTVEYYLARTSHGSTLSGIVHAWVLARSDRPRSWELFRSALRSDIHDVQGGTTPEGIHLGAMAGTVDMMQRGYLGLETRCGALRFNPNLPDGVERLSLCLRYRGQGLDVTVERDRLRIASGPAVAEPIRIVLRDRDEKRLPPGGDVAFDL